MKLDPQDIAAIAESVARRLDTRIDDAPRFVDAAHIARLLSVERDWVYEHSDELGGIRLGGPRGRLRFDRLTLPERLAQNGQHRPARAVGLAQRKGRGAQQRPQTGDTGR